MESLLFKLLLLAACGGMAVLPLPSQPPGLQFYPTYVPRAVLRTVQQMQQEGAFSFPILTPGGQSPGA